MGLTDTEFRALSRLWAGSRTASQVALDLYGEGTPSKVSTTKKLLDAVCRAGYARRRKRGGGGERGFHHWEYHPVRTEDDLATMVLERLSRLLGQAAVDTAARHWNWSGA